MDKLKITIITATHNRAPSGFLEKCIQSVYRQSPGNYEYEHIIVDDGSTDDTEHLIKRLMLNNKSLVYYKKVNGGAASAYKYGIEKATGDYTTFLDDDDLLPKDSLKERSEYIHNNNPDWFYGNAEWIDDDGNCINVGFQSEFYSEHLYERQLISNVIHGGTTVVKSSVLKKIEWPAWLERSQDYFICLELLRPENGYALGFLDKAVYTYRIHKQAYTAMITSTEESFSSKEKLNHKIRLLHGDRNAFFAEEIYKTRKELWETYKEVYRLGKELQIITGSVFWKLLKPFRLLYRSLK